MSSVRLLSPDIRAEVEQAVEAAYLRLETHHNRRFSRPEIRFDLHNSRGGEAWFFPETTDRIRFNLVLLLENKVDFIATIVPHEVAHLVAYSVHGTKRPNGVKLPPHGREWSEQMEILGVPSRKYHTYDLASLDIHPQARTKDSRSKTEKELTRVRRMLEAIEKMGPLAKQVAIAGIMGIIDET